MAQLDPWGLVVQYGAQLFGGVRRAFNYKGGTAPLPTRESIAADKQSRQAKDAADQQAASIKAAAETERRRAEQEKILLLESAYTNRGLREPKRLSGRKAAGKKKLEQSVTDQLAAQGIWPYTYFASQDLLSTGDKVIQGVGQAGLVFAMSGGTYSNTPRSPGMGTRSSQKGFVSALPTKSRAPGHYEPDYWNANSPGARYPKPPSAPASTAPKPQRRPGTILPHMPAPQLEQQLPTAPETLTQEYTRVSRPARLATAQPVYPGSRPATPTPGTTRLPGVTGTPTSKPRKTGSRSSVARAAVGAIELSPSALFADAFRSSRSSSRFAGPGSASPIARTATSTATQFAADPLSSVITSAAGRKPKDQSCECEPGKKRKRSPRKPRTVCYSGTYKESATGISKTRREEVPCTQEKSNARVSE